MAMTLPKAASMRVTDIMIDPIRSTDTIASDFVFSHAQATSHLRSALAGKGERAPEALE